VRATQLNRLAGAIQRDGMTLVPLKIYFNDRGMAKLELAVAKGKNAPDKREAEKQKDWNRQKERLLKDNR
jgi:SsrA-binding protein